MGDGTKMIDTRTAQELARDFLEEQDASPRVRALICIGEDVWCVGPADRELVDWGVEDHRTGELVQGALGDVVKRLRDIREGGFAPRP